MPAGLGSLLPPSPPALLACLLALRATAAALAPEAAGLWAHGGGDDDECLAAGSGEAGSSCALSALQLRAAALREVAGLRSLAEDDSERSRGPPYCLSRKCSSSRKHGMRPQCRNGVTVQRVNAFDKDCANKANCCCRGCLLWFNAKAKGGSRTCKNGKKVLTARGKFIPPVPWVTGTEYITGFKRASAWNYLWSCAAAAGFSRGAPMATRRLTANAFTGRSQHVLHIHVGPLSAKGEKKVVSYARKLNCQRSQGWQGWQKVIGPCKQAWIKTFKPHTFPNVWTQVLALARKKEGRALYKNGLGTFGISVVWICSSPRGCPRDPLRSRGCSAFMPAIVASTNGLVPRAGQEKNKGCHPEGTFVR